MLFFVVELKILRHAGHFLEQDFAELFGKFSVLDSRLQGDLLAFFRLLGIASVLVVIQLDLYEKVGPKQ